MRLNTISVPLCLCTVLLILTTRGAQAEARRDIREIAAPITPAGRTLQLNDSDTMLHPAGDSYIAVRSTWVERITPSVVEIMRSPTSGTVGGALNDWHNSGGNAGRNGRSAEVGPDGADLQWSGGRSSIIAWQPVIEGPRAFMVRQLCFPPPHATCAPADAPVVAVDVDTGEELWAEDIPFNDGDWTTWIAGVRDGRVYAGRSGNGASVSAKIYALDVVDGNMLWASDDDITAGPYDGVVFAPNGDLIIGSFNDLWRIRALDGSTAWHSARSCSVSSSCGAATSGEGVYIIDAVPGGHVLKRFDLASGAASYSSTLMPGFTIQNTPMVGPDGTIYVSRTQNNPVVDIFYAFEDTGTALVEKWSVPAGWTTASEFAVGPDGSVYMMAPDHLLARLNPDDGSVVDSSAALPSAVPGARLAVDDLGRVFLSNTEFSLGRLYSFDADLTDRWDVPIPNVNIGGPALGRCGTLVMCGIGSDVRAYRSKPADACACVADLNHDGQVDAADLANLLGSWGSAPGSTADLNGDDQVDAADLAILLGGWGPCG